MSGDSHSRDRWAFRLDGKPVPPRFEETPIVLVAIDEEDGTEYVIGYLIDRNVAGYVVMIHNATLDLDS